MIDNLLDPLFRKDTEIVYDKAFINRIYKRTERCIAGVFFITQRSGSSGILQEMTDTSLLVLKDLSDLLGYERTAARPVLLAVAARLTYLSSLLTLGSVSGVLRESHAGLLLHELDTIKGEISEYIASDDRSPLRARMKDRQREGLGERDERDTQPAPHGSVVVPNAVSRTERIKDIIRTKGQVSIKDISEVIKDVSEKSIQRDLNDLIDSGQVVRKGERRWSVYLLNNIPDA